MLILFIIYLGYIALRAAIEDETKGAKLAAVLCMVGLVNLPIIHFSVQWWSTLHQGSSVIREGGPSLDQSMLTPLLIKCLCPHMLESDLKDMEIMIGGGVCRSFSQIESAYSLL